jgi:hypothetical protein
MHAESCVASGIVSRWMGEIRDIRMYNDVLDHFLSSYARSLTLLIAQKPVNTS